MKYIKKRPLPFTLAFAWVAPSLVLAIVWVGETIGLHVPELDAREYAWLMSTTMGIILVIGISRLEGSRRAEDRPGFESVIEELKQAEIVATRTEASVKELTAVLKEQGVVSANEFGGPEDESDHKTSKTP